MIRGETPLHKYYRNIYIYIIVKAKEASLYICIYKYYSEWNERWFRYIIVRGKSGIVIYIIERRKEIHFIYIYIYI